MKTTLNRIAEIIIPEGVDRRGRPTRIETAYGQKSREGIADLIEQETGISDLSKDAARLDMLENLANVTLWEEANGRWHIRHDTSETPQDIQGETLREALDNFAKATGK